MCAADSGRWWVGVCIKRVCGCERQSVRVCAAVSDGVYAVDSGYVGVHVGQLGFTKWVRQTVSGGVCVCIRKY